ncbi:MAG: dephospho-CoA kinase [Coriobacteriia bacterium]|nr:dephospho-CoA kinase [Coriobacteriia bacterium]
MHTIFVTGSMASGKRSACRHLATKGFTHIDLDEVAKEFLASESVKHQLALSYGKGIFDDEGNINSSELAARAFTSKESTAALNEIMWPLVANRLASLLSCEDGLDGRFSAKHVVEIAMLAEAPGFSQLADAVIGISAREDIRIKRALARGMHLEDIHKRMALQASDSERADCCDVVIENNGSLADLHARLDEWFHTYNVQLAEHMF